MTSDADITDETDNIIITPLDINQPHSLTYGSNNNQWKQLRIQ